MKTPIPPKGIDLSKSIWLDGQVPSSKNSKEIGFMFLAKGSEGNWFFKQNGVLKAIRPTLRSSEATEAYVKHIAVQIIENKPRFIELIKGLPKPYFIQLHFVRKTKGRYDFSNAQQILADCFTGHYWTKHKTIPYIATQWLEDDDVTNVYFIPPLIPPHYSVDPNNPGVWITVITNPYNGSKTISLNFDEQGQFSFPTEQTKPE